MDIPVLYSLYNIVCTVLYCTLSTVLALSAQLSESLNGFEQDITDGMGCENSFFLARVPYFIIVQFHMTETVGFVFYGIGLVCLID